jgi:hypothetical protein
MAALSPARPSSLTAALVLETYPLSRDDASPFVQRAADVAMWNERRLRVTLSSSIDAGLMAAHGASSSFPRVPAKAGS